MAKKSDVKNETVPDAVPPAEAPPVETPPEEKPSAPPAVEAPAPALNIKDGKVEVDVKVLAHLAVSLVTLRYMNVIGQAGLMEIGRLLGTKSYAETQEAWEQLKAIYG